MGFIQKEWSNPISVNATELNRIEKGVKDSHDSIEILGGEISNLQLKQRQAELDIQKLTNNSNILETLTNLQAIVNNNSSLIETLQDTSNLVTQAQLSSSLGTFLRLTDIKQDGQSIVNGSEVNITTPTIDKILNRTSNNAISNKAVTLALEELASAIHIPTKLKDLQEDPNHLLVTENEKALWNSIQNISFTETDPTVPNWAKQSSKPQYEWIEILNTPEIHTQISEFPDVNNFSRINHDHDNRYALIQHDHDNRYAQILHSHLEYASADHNHDDLYAAKNHTHDFDTSAIEQSLEEEINARIIQGNNLRALIDALSMDYNDLENLPDLSIYALATDLTNHNHDTQYAALNHTHNYAASSHTHTTTDITDLNLSNYATTSSLEIKGGVYRGTFGTWNVVPSTTNGYIQDANGGTTPLKNDYIILNDGSGKLNDASFLYLSDTSGARATIANTYNGTTQSVIYYNATGSANAKILNGVVSVYYDSGPGKWVITTLVNCVFNSVSYTAGNVIAQWGYASYSEGYINYDTNTNGGIFVYDGVWATDGKDGWKVVASIKAMTSGYASINHTHNNYALLNHNHDSSYAALNHNHNNYALTTHTHDYSSVYAAINHNHNSDYAAINHTHNEFSNIVDSTTIQGMIDTSISALINGAPTTLDTLKELADAIEDNADLITALNTAVTNHNHDTTYAALSHTHTKSQITDFTHTHTVSDITDIATYYAGISHNHDATYSAINHNHDTLYAALNHNHDSIYLKLSGGTLTGPLKLTGVSGATDGSIQLDNTSNSQIADTNNHTIFGFRNDETSNLYLGASTYTLKLRGSATRPTYNNNDLALYKEALPNYSISIGSTGAGNPRQVKFLSVNYTNYDGNNACFIKLGAMCSHGNGTSYIFMDDIFIGVSSSGTVTCNVYKYFQSSPGTNGVLDNAQRYYGDVFWVIDTTNKVVDFYILCGQYSTMNFTPYTKIGATTSNGITQSSGTVVLYSSGTRNWANGNGNTYTTSGHNHDTVYAPLSHTHNYSAVYTGSSSTKTSNTTLSNLRIGYTSNNLYIWNS